MIRSKVFWIGLCTLIFSAIPFNGEAQGEAPSSTPASIVVSFPLIADWCQQLVPSLVRVEVLASSLARPLHSRIGYQRLSSLDDSVGFIRMGYGLDEWTDRLLPLHLKANANRLVLQEADADLMGVDQDDIDQWFKASKPYYWLDPLWAQDAVRSISDFLKQTFPQDVEQIERNTEKAIAGLAQFHLKAARQIAASEAQPFILLGEGLLPFVERYGLKPTAIIRTTSTLTFLQWERLHALLQTMESPVIVVENHLWDVLKRTIRTSNVQVVQLSAFPKMKGKKVPIGTSPYLEMMNTNLDILLEHVTIQIEPSAPTDDELGQQTRLELLPQID